MQYYRFIHSAHIGAPHNSYDIGFDNNRMIIWMRDEGERWTCAHEIDREKLDSKTFSALKAKLPISKAQELELTLLDRTILPVIKAYLKS